MFDIGKIIKRSWQILWNYKVLWIFGFLMALTGSGGGGGGGGGGGSSWRSSVGQNGTNPFSSSSGQLNAWFESARNWFALNFGPWFATEQATLHTIMLLIVGFALLAVVIGLLFSLVRYPAETAVMRMVDENEQTGTKMKFKQGWKLGWNIRAFRVWLIDTVLAMPGLIIAILVLGAVALTLNSAAVGNDLTRVSSSMLIWVILAFVLFLPVALLAVFLGMLRQFIVRFAAIEGTGFSASFSKGWALFKSGFKHVFITWLVLLGIGIGVGFVLILVFFLLVPAYVVMTIPAAIAAVLPGAAVYGITTLFSAEVWPWIIGGIVALPIFFAVVFSPLTFISGWVTLFTSNVWTLAFRQFKSMIVPPLPVGAEEEKQIEE